MNKRLGTYLTRKWGTESYKAFLPPALPPDPALNLQELIPALEKATRAIAELNSITKTIPNFSLFIYMYVRKEALLSSQIEGTQSSFSDLLLFEQDKKITISQEDVEEVSNYVKAINHGLNRLNKGFPLSLRLIREIHELLLSGTRGSEMTPGEFRRSQNWIGGNNPRNARFVPPPPEELMHSLSDLEDFLHDTKSNLPVLIKAGLIHVQFETIHPFLDGNGRVGRLLIILLLCEKQLLEEPILYVSLYLKQNRTLYYDLLQEVRQKGDWEKWLTFFLEAITVSAQQALQTAHNITRLFQKDTQTIDTLGRAKFSCLAVLDYAKKVPQFSIIHLSHDLHITAPTARTAVNHLITLGILKELSGKKRDKIYVYQKYLALLEEGTEPLS